MLKTGKQTILYMMRSCLIVVFSVFLFSACKPAKEKTITISVLETTDVHGAIFPYDFIQDKSAKGSLAQVHTYVKGLKDDAHRQVVLIDNGDNLQGQPSVYYSNFIDTLSLHINSKVMNYMGYDLTVIGNHDIEAGPAVYDRLTAEYHFPVLGANVLRHSDNMPYFKPYHIVKKKGIKLAFLGLITPGVPNWLPENLYKGLYFEDMLVSAKKWVKLIQEKEKPDLLIGVFHAGYDYSYGNASKEDKFNENASLIVAEKVPGFHAIFIGHDHQIHNSWHKTDAGDSVLIIDPKSSGQFVGQVDFEFVKCGRKVTLKKAEGKIVDMSDVQASSDFLKTFKNEYEKIKTYVDEPLGVFSKTISSQQALLGPSCFTDLINGIQLDISGADLSFTAPLSRDAEIKQGQVFVRDMFKLYRFENLLYTMRLSGKEIDAFLEHSYAGWYDKPASGHLLKFKKDDKGRVLLRNGRPSTEVNYYNYDVAEGIDYSVDVTKTEGNRVRILAFSNGNAFEMDKVYKVAVNSYRGNGGGGHLTIGAGLSKEELKKRLIYSTEKDLRYYIMEWIKDEKIVTPVVTDNWEIVPDDWFLEAAKKDSLLIFSNLN